MSIASHVVRLDRASAAHQAAAAKAKRGMFAVIERRRSYTMMHGATHAEFSYTPCIVASIDRAGIVKAVRLAGQEWLLPTRDWSRITVDSRGQVADPAMVTAKLVNDFGAAIEYEDHAAAVAAIRAAAGFGEA